MSHVPDALFTFSQTRYTISTPYCTFYPPEPSLTPFVLAEPGVGVSVVTVSLDAVVAGLSGTTGIAALAVEAKEEAGVGAEAGVEGGADDPGVGVEGAEAG